MPAILAGARGLLGGWLLAGSTALLTQPATIGTWHALGLHHQACVGLALAELSGAALFAFVAFATIGFVLLLGAFAFAAALHLRLGEAPWILALYALVAALLLYGTRRSRCAAARS